MVLSRNNSIEPTDAEVAIQELRLLSEDVLVECIDMDDDYNLIRFLRACGWDVKKAHARLRNAGKWRTENDISALVYQDSPLHILERMPLHIDGHTSDGLLVGSIEAGKIDFRALLDELGRKEIIQFAMQSFAQAEKVLTDQNQKYFKNKRITKDSFVGAIVVVDFKGFSYWQLQSIKGVQLSIEICQMLANYFPELGSHLICINCNRVAKILIKMLKPIMKSPYLKIDVFGEKPEEWTKAVLAEVPADQVREPFGGTKTGKYVYIRPDCLIPPHLRSCEKKDEIANI